MDGLSRGNASIERLGTRQHGLVTLSQAVEDGLTGVQIQHRLDTGRWERLRPGVYAIVGTAPTWQQALLAAVWGCAQPTVASHWSAARLWGVSVPAGAHRV